MKNLCKPLIIVIVLIFFIRNQQLFAQITIDEIITKHLEASGFNNIPSELKKFKVEGEMIQNKIHFPLTINGILPDKLRMDLIYNNQNFSKISNGPVSWDYNPANDSIKTYINKKTESLDFIDRLTGELYNYKNGIIKINLLGILSIDDVELYKLEVQVDKSVRIYYIDKLSYLIRRIDDDVVENRITYYSDYRKVGKYLLPFSLTGFEGGLSSISMQFKSIIVNPDIKEELFDKPLLNK